MEEQTLEQMCQPDNNITHEERDRLRFEPIVESGVLPEEGSVIHTSQQAINMTAEHWFAYLWREKQTKLRVANQPKVKVKSEADIAYGVLYTVWLAECKEINDAKDIAKVEWRKACDDRKAIIAQWDQWVASLRVTKDASKAIVKPPVPTKP
jgi:hypothetical protein